MFAVGFLALLVRYIDEGAGLRFWVPQVSSTSILVGLVHVVGLCTASLLCFAVATGLWADGLVPKDTVHPAPRGTGGVTRFYK